VGVWGLAGVKIANPPYAKVTRTAIISTNTYSDSLTRIQRSCMSHGKMPYHFPPILKTYYDKFQFHTTKDHHNDLYHEDDKNSTVNVESSCSQGLKNTSTLCKHNNKKTGSETLVWIVLTLIAIINTF
jgi:hypothetical protein